MVELTNELQPLNGEANRMAQATGKCGCCNFTKVDYCMRATTLKIFKSINACHERNNNCLDGCDDCYDKQLQKSQYYMQYRRPVQIVFSVFLLILLIEHKHMP